jgi:hypothetical protein
VLVGKLDTSCSIDEDASVLDSLENMDDWVVTEESISSEETIVDTPEPNVCEEAEADEVIPWEETVENAPVPDTCEDAEVDVSTIREGTVDDVEPNICEEANADVLTI